jgi:putative hydrolases of HD superfamily
MKHLESIKYLLKLKEVDRVCTVKDRKESAAEHTWSAMILAQYFLKISSVKLDEAKVMKLLLYHDLVEIETGDVGIFREDYHELKKNEEAAAIKVKESLPIELQEEFKNSFNEFEELKTPEAKFSKAIDRLEGSIAFLDNKPAWKKVNATEVMIREKYDGGYMDDFPEVLSFFNELIIYLRENGYFFGEA